jgi:hypothetical protein
MGQSVLIDARLRPQLIGSNPFLSNGLCINVLRITASLCTLWECIWLLEGDFHGFVILPNLI